MDRRWVQKSHTFTYYKLERSRILEIVERLLLTTLTISDEATKGFFSTEITEHSNFDVTRGSGGN